MQLKLKHLTIVVLLIIKSFNYQIQNNVLLIQDSDFPSILQQIPYIFISFESSQSEVCRKLKSVIQQSAVELLQTKPIPVKFGRVDIGKSPIISQSYQISGYPTFIFFINGNKINYSGQKIKEQIVRWACKKISLPAIQIKNQTQLNQIINDKFKSVKIIGFFNQISTCENFINIAKLDDYNYYYYFIQSNLQNSYVRIYRNFDQPVTFTGVITDYIQEWIKKYSRPALSQFDYKIIHQYYGNGRTIVILFNSFNQQKLHNILENVAKIDSENYLFAELHKQNEHFFKFSEYIKMNVDQPRLIIIGNNNKKAVYFGSIQVIDEQQIIKFINNYKYGQLSVLDLIDKVNFPSLKISQNQQEL